MPDAVASSAGQAAGMAIGIVIGSVAEVAVVGVVKEGRKRRDDIEVPVVVVERQDVGSVRAFEDNCVAMVFGEDLHLVVGGQNCLKTLQLREAAAAPVVLQASLAHQLPGPVPLEVVAGGLVLSKTKAIN